MKIPFSLLEDSCWVEQEAGEYSVFCEKLRIPLKDAFLEPGDEQYARSLSPNTVIVIPYLLMEDSCWVEDDGGVKTPHCEDLHVPLKNVLTRKSFL